MVRLSRQTNRNYSTSPRSLEDLILPPEYTHASSGEPLLLWDSGYTAERRRSFLFGTPTNTTTLMDADHLVIDGTFKSAPQLMTQMVGIHGIFDSGWHIPLAYGLLPGKTQSLYSSLLENLDTFGPYDPQSVLCDYEFALHNAIAQTWPCATVRGCHFHYSQALWRRLQREDLVPEYQVENSSIRKAFKLIVTDVKTTKMMMREQPEPRAAKRRRYDERLQNIISNFDSYPTVLDFLKCASCLV